MHISVYARMFHLLCFRTVLEFEDPHMANVTGSTAFFKAVWRFLAMFFGSSLIGMFSGLCSALVSFVVRLLSEDRKVFKNLNVLVAKRDICIVSCYVFQIFLLVYH